MLDVKPATVVIDDIEYTLNLGTINYTHIGPEDHGIFSVNVDFSFGGSGQGTGHYSLGEHGEYLGTFVKNFLDVVGVDEWEKLRGRSVFVLRRADDGWGGTIKGFVKQDMSRHMIIRDTFDNFEQVVKSGGLTD